MDRNKRVSLFLLLFTLFGSLALSKEILKFSLFPITSNMEIHKVNSAGDYVLFKHLNKNLIEFDQDGHLYGDLAEKWKISKDRKVYIFTLRDNIFFSDGSQITSKDVVSSFSDVKEKGGGIHFDFSNIKSIDALSNKSFAITLKKTTPRFLRNLVHPEFGIRKLQNIKKHEYAVTSGCYKLKEKTIDNIILEKNATCSDFKNDVKTLSFSFVPPKDQVKSISEHKKDFYISFMKPDDLIKATSDGSYLVEKPHIGFTFWLSVNPKSATFKSKQVRDSFYNVFKKNFSINSNDVSIEIAQQLYLPNGPGRLKNEEIEAIVSKKSLSKSDLSTKSVKVLLPIVFDYNQKIIDILKKTFTTVKIDYYKDQDEFSKINYVKYDLFLTNNDFSSLDLYENLFVSFNPVRPLIHSNTKIKKLLGVLKDTIDERETYELYKAIGQVLLEDSLIIPLVHKNILFIKSKDLDISAWSMQFPEISAWKIKVKK